MPVTMLRMGSPYAGLDLRLSRGLRGRVGRMPTPQRAATRFRTKLMMTEPA